MIGAILGALKALPELISLGKTAIEAITNLAYHIHVQNKLKKFEIASNLAKEGKDTSELEKLFRGD